MVFADALWVYYCLEFGPSVTNIVFVQANTDLRPTLVESSYCVGDVFLYQTAIANNIFAQLREREAGGRLSTSPLRTVEIKPVDRIPAYVVVVVRRSPLHGMTSAAPSRNNVRAVLKRVL